MESISQARLAQAKQSYATRRVFLQDARTIVSGSYTPEAGDVVLAKIKSIGSHGRIELPNGRKASLHIGDEVLLAFGHRYAPDQYEAYVPEALDPCHMVAAGGIAAKAVSWHNRLSGPTAIDPVGVLCNGEGEPLNLKNYAVPTLAGPMPSAVFGVFGTSMNAGKTATAAALVRGFAQNGYRVGALKITGTAAGGDPWLMHDSGACEVLDFTDAGMATTFGVPLDTLVAASRNLLRTLSRSDCDLAVVEIADGLFQDETRQLAESALMQSLFDGIVFAAADALGAAAGATRLNSLGYNVLGVSGALLRSPLAAREAVTNLDLPAYGLDMFSEPDTISRIMKTTAACRLAAAG